MSNGRWRGWENAEIYDRFVREHRIYRWLNARLVERADVAHARRVLDLGCGTGATTQACLQQLPSDGEVVGLDASEEMVAVARAHTQDRRARFVVAPAERLGETVEGPFDRAVSNAAFWQFPRAGPVLAALAERMPPGGLFVFNVPAERTDAGGTPHPFQLALARAIEERRGEPFSRTASAFDPAHLQALAADAGFRVEREEALTYEGPQGELMELMSIPAMIEPLTRGLSAEDVEAVLAQAWALVEPQERVRVAWLYLTLRREG